MNRKNIVTILLIVVVCLVILFGAWFRVKKSNIDNRFDNVIFKVIEVIDGDTMRLKSSNANIVVRALGIDTPETVHPDKPVECFGKEASAKAKELLLGREVLITFSPNRERQDKYRRYLTYIHRRDGLFFNQYMLENGYAREYTVGKQYSKQREFKFFQDLARKDSVGIWSKCYAK